MIYLDKGGQGPGLVAADGRIDPADRGFLLGDGLYETMRCRSGAVPLLEWHLWRLAESAAALALPADPEGFRWAVLAVAETAGSGEHALRLTLSRGAAAGRGYNPPPDPSPTLLVTSQPYEPPVGPLRLVRASTRIWPGAVTARHKSLSALEKVMARAEAARAGADEALLLNTSGRVAEGAAANIFIRRGDRWLTPPVAEGCLPGVMRRRVIGLTGAREEPLSAEELFDSDGVYLTNALIGCLPAASLDGVALPPAEPFGDPGRLFLPVR